MRRYHFHVVDGLELFDSKGLVLADDRAARTHAEGMAASLQTSSAMDRGIKAIRVVDEEGKEVARIRVQSAIRHAGRNV